MGSLLAPVLAGIFMAELERAVIPKLSQHLQFWKHYVNDTICFACNGYQKFVLSCLNSFHNSIQFTYKIEKEREIFFLDILIIHSGEKIETHIYRNSTNTDIYIHWNLTIEQPFSPTYGKMSVRLLVTPFSFLFSP